jgi:hypothetical protein
MRVRKPLRASDPIEFILDPSQTSRSGPWRDPGRKLQPKVLGLDPRQAKQGYERTGGVAVEVEIEQARWHEENAADAPARARDAYVVCRAETAECTCPDVCERDHGND